MILGCIEVLAEAQTLSEKAGIGAEVAHNFVKGITSSDLPVKRYRSSVSSIHRLSSCPSVRAESCDIAIYRLDDDFSAALLHMATRWPVTCSTVAKALQLMEELKMPCKYSSCIFHFPANFVQTYPSPH